MRIRTLLLSVLLIAAIAPRAERAEAMPPQDAATAKAYATHPNGPYAYYYRSLFTKLKRNGRIELFKTRRDQPDDEVTLESICDKLVIYGTPDSVADQFSSSACA